MSSAQIGLTRRQACVLLPAAALLPGCAARVNPTNPDVKPISFDSPPIPLRVERIGQLIRPQISADAAPIDGDFVVSLEEIARLWPTQRLQAAGGNFEAAYIVDDASAVSRRVEDREVIVATLQVRLVIRTLYGVEEAEAGARVESELRIQGEPNMIRRQEMLHGIAISVAREFDEKMSAAIRKRLSPYVTRGS